MYTVSTAASDYNTLLKQTGSGRPCLLLFFIMGGTFLLACLAVLAEQKKKALVVWPN